MMFSYGSGCAASLFTVRFTADYKKVAAKSEDYKVRLAQRRRVPAAEYDAIMAKRQANFGKFDYSPEVSLFFGESPILGSNF